MGAQRALLVEISSEVVANLWEDGVTRRWELNGPFSNCTKGSGSSDMFIRNARLVPQLLSLSFVIPKCKMLQNVQISFDSGSF